MNGDIIDPLLLRTPSTLSSKHYNRNNNKSKTSTSMMIASVNNDNGNNEEKIEDNNNKDYVDNDNVEDLHDVKISVDYDDIDENDVNNNINNDEDNDNNNELSYQNFSPPNGSVFVSVILLFPTIVSIELIFLLFSLYYTNIGKQYFRFNESRTLRHSITIINNNNFSSATPN